MSWDEQAFLKKLEETHQFPEDYTFKFIVKQEHQKAVEKLVASAKISLKLSKKKNYVSVSLSANMQSGQEIIEVYKRAQSIESIIAL